MSKLEVKTTKTSDNIKFEFAGQIDEDVAFPEIPPGTQLVTLHLAHLKLINSCGIREWLKWLAKLPPGCKIKYTFCPPAFVDQVNMVEGFLPPHASVESLYIPYFCPACNEMTSVVVTDTQEYLDGSKRPQDKTSCRHCRAQAELDINPDKYFSFLRRKR